MAITFDCPCGRRLKVRDDLAGQTVRCPACGKQATVPDEEEGSNVVRPAENIPPSVRSAGKRTGGRRSRADKDGDRSRRRRRFEDDNSEDQDDRIETERRQPEATSGKAIASLVLGLLGLICLIFTGLPGLILGILGLSDIRRSRGRLGGMGLAIAGLVLSGLTTLVGLGFALSMARSVHEISERTKAANNLRNIGLAMHDYCRNNRDMIPLHAAVTDKNGRPLLSWRVAMLPYLEEEALYQKFHLDEPWDSPHNMTLIPLMPKVYVHPAAKSSVTAQGMTHFRAITGPLSAFEPRLGQPPRFPATITDGISTTIMAAEATDPVIWTKPEELEFRPGGPLPRLGLTPGQRFHVLFWNASILSIFPEANSEDLKAAMTANGGEIFEPAW